MKRFLCLLLALSLAALSGCGSDDAPSQEESGGEEPLRVVATIFPGYDFARAAAGDLAEVQLLLPPGAESHSYEPTPADILAIEACDVFIYLGGESDAWVDTILESMDREGIRLRMVDCVELLEEETVEGMEDEDHDHQDTQGPGAVVGMDEHVWTSPANAAQITRAIGEALGEADPENAQVYQENAQVYAGEIEALDEQFRTFFEGLSDPTMVFGDRFPLRYFAEEYGISYYAAFPGCSTQTEPSAATIAFLTEKVRQEGLGTVWYIEFSNHLVADSIAEATGAQAALFHTCHNVSQEEMDSGATYVSLMEKNLQTLQEQMG